MIYLKKSFNSTIKVKEMAPEERPREKMLAKGVKSLSNAELLAILLRTGNKNKNAIELAKLYNK
nr:UPF0758 domain-containing protein [Clostridioides difficile]